MSKVSESQKRADAKYKSKANRKLITFRPAKDNELLACVEADSDKFIPLVRRLLSDHYNIDYVE